MPSYPITVETNPEDIAFIKQKSGVHDEDARRKLGIFVRDTGGHIVGGVYGWISDGWLYVDTLWIDESLRGQDYGTRLLCAIEQAAVARGVNRCFLMTLGFQARPFYEKRGYTVFFTQDDFLAGYAVYGLKKTGLTRDKLPVDEALRVDDPPDQEDIQALGNHLGNFNERFIGSVPYGTLAVLMRDGEGRIISGFCGPVFALSYNIDYAWVSSPDYWPPLIERLEQVVTGDTGKQVFLRLLGDELLPIFQEAGYKISGTFDDFPAGSVTYYLAKTL